MGKCRQNPSFRGLSRLGCVRRHGTFPAILLFVFAAAATLGLAACGGGDGADLLPGSTAREIRANLEDVRGLADEGECVGARDAALEVSDQVEALGGVDPRLKQALQEGAERLNEVLIDCEETTTEEDLEAEPSVSDEAFEVEEEGEDRSQHHAKPGKKQPPGHEEEPEKDVETTPKPETTTEETPNSAGETSPPSDGGTPSGGVSPSIPAEGE